MIDLSDLLTGAGTFVAGVGSALLGNIVRLRGQRRDDFSAILDAHTQLTGRLEAEVSRLDTELGEVRTECAGWRDAHQTCLQRESRLTTRVQHLEGRLSTLEAQTPVPTLDE